MTLEAPGRTERELGAIAGMGLHGDGAVLGLGGDADGDVPSSECDLGVDYEQMETDGRPRVVCDYPAVTGLIVIGLPSFIKQRVAGSSSARLVRQ